MRWMVTRCVGPLVCGVLLSVPPGVVLAEINVVESVEWCTVDAEVVVRGVVRRVGRTATVTVAETYKGPPAAMYTLRNTEVQAIKGLARSDDALFFFQREPATGSLHLRHGPVGPSVLPLQESWLATRGPPSDDFQLLHTRGELLTRVRETVVRFADRVAVPKVFLDVPEETPVFRRFYDGSSVWVVVPWHPVLETRCRRWRVLSETGRLCTALHLTR